MEEDKTQGVTNQEAAEPEVKSENTEPESQQANSVKTQDDKEQNFARLREKAEKAEREKALLEKELNEIRATINRQNAAQPVEEDELSNLAADDIITVNQAMKLSEKQAKKIVQEILEQKEKASLPEKTRSKFADFDQVMTQENIKKLEIEEPGLADACLKSSNPYEATYKILKKFYVSEEKKPAEKKTGMDPPNSIYGVSSQRPLANVNSWSEASKERLYKEMMEAARRL